MRAIVFDSSTLILLVKSDLLKLLISEQDVYIPPSVLDESTRKDTVDAVHIKHLVGTNKIHVKSIQGNDTVAALLKDFRLGQGEAEAITLAKEINALCGIDDYLGLRACRTLEVPFANAMGFLVDLYHKRELTQKETISKLNVLNEVGWYKKTLIERIKHEIQTGQEDK